MKVIYNKPRDIIKEIEDVLSENLVKTEDEQEVRVKKIILTKDEMSILKRQLTKDWDNMSDVQCHRVESDNDPYTGGYSFLEWDGEWRTKDHSFIKIEEEEL